MFDGRWRSSFEKGLRPVGENIRRTGITADHLTATGLVMAAAASIAIANGALRAGLLLLVLCAVPDLLDGAVAKAAGTASPRGAFFDSVADRVTDALLLGGVAWFLASNHPGRIAVLPMAVLGCVDAHLLRAGQGGSARVRRQGRAHGACRATHRPRVRPAVRLPAHPGALGDARAHPGHGRAAVRARVAPGERPAPAAGVEPLAWTAHGSVH